MPPEEKTPARPVHRSRIVMWLALAAIAATVVVSVVIGVRVGLLLLASVLGTFAIVRAASPAPGPYGISIRSRAFDVTLLAAGALLIAGVTISLPSSALG